MLPQNEKEFLERDIFSGIDKVHARPVFDFLDLLRNKTVVACLRNQLQWLATSPPKKWNLKRREID
jgi:hypothetical protein